MSEATTQVLCLECDAAVQAPENPLIGEVITCGDCGTELEIVAADPMLLVLAPEIEEDWGE